MNADLFWLNVNIIVLCVSFIIWFSLFVCVCVQLPSSIFRFIFIVAAAMFRQRPFTHCAIARANRWRAQMSDEWSVRWHRLETWIQRRLPFIEYISDQHQSLINWDGLSFSLLHHWLLHFVESSQQFWMVISLTYGQTEVAFNFKTHLAMQSVLKAQKQGNARNQTFFSLEYKPNSRIFISWRHKNVY